MLFQRQYDIFTKNYQYTLYYSKTWGRWDFNVLESFLYSPMLHLFGQKYSKNGWNVKQQFSMGIYCKM